MKRRILGLFLLVASVAGTACRTRPPAGPRETAAEVVASRSRLPDQPTESDRDAILAAAVRDILTDPAHEEIRESFGTKGEKRVGLVKDSPVPWPASFPPSIPGHEVFFLTERRGGDPTQPRLLGLRLDKFNLHERTGPLRTHVAVCVYNAGGTANGEIEGGCTIYYNARRKDGKWVVDCEGYESQ